MIRLLLETATEVCSVAVARDSVLLAEHTALEAHQHSSHLTLFIQQVIEQAGLTLADVDEIVLSDGPGSYTSLRVGAATAKGLCMALPHIKLRVVPTLRTLATLTRDAHPTLATINSRRGQVYGQFFGASSAGSVKPRPQAHGPVPNGVQGEVDQAVEGDIWCNPQNIILTEADWFERLKKAAGREIFHVSGPGQQRVLEHLPEGVQLRGLQPEHCSAVHLLAPAAAPAMSRPVDIASYEPFYLNPPFVTKSKKKLLGR